MAFSWILSPFGMDLFCLRKKFLVFNLVSRNLKTKYRRSVFGILWTLLSPMAMAMIYYFVFKVILKIQVPHYLVFILSGVLPWTFFAQTLMEGLESIVGNWGLLSKVPIPLQVFPYVGTVTNLVTLALSLPVLLGAAVVSHVPLGLSLLMLPYFLGLLFLSAYSVSLLLSIGFVFFRDLRHFMTLVMQLWFYGTPVIYDTSMIPSQYQPIVLINPVGGVFAGIHEILAHGRWPQFEYVLSASLWTLTFVVLACTLERAYGHGVVEQI